MSEVKEAFKEAEKYMEHIPPYTTFIEMAQKFLQDSEGEDSQEMLAYRLGFLLSVTWEAGKFRQRRSEL